VQQDARRDDERLSAVCGLDDPVRRSLYAFVAGSHEPVSRDDAAAAAAVGRPLAAYHLDKLVALGLLTASYQRPRGRGGPGAGRPAKVYARSRTEFAVSLPPRAYDLAAGLLAQAVQADPDGEAMTELLRAARRYGTSLAEQDQPERHEPEQHQHGRPAKAALAVLTAHGFEPSQDEDGTIVLRNCPFHQLAVGYPDVVCGMNLSLLEGVLDVIGARGLRPVLNPAPGRCCVVIRTDDQGQQPPGER
jgi:predicted ArsR family transcriptional regulator